MAAELERVHAEVQRLRSTAGMGQPAGYLRSARARAVDDEIATRGAVIAGTGRLGRLAGAVDSALATDLHRNVLETTAAMEKAETQASGPRARAIAQEVTDIFSGRHFAHQAAFYDAFGEQAIQQLSQDLPAPPPPPRRRFRLFGDD